MFVGADAYIGPLGSREFAEDFRKKTCVLREDKSRPPLRSTGERRLVVGADDSVDPLGSYEFAEDSCETGASCRADVGIGPYESF